MRMSTLHPCPLIGNMWASGNVGTRFNAIDGSAMAAGYEGCGAVFIVDVGMDFLFWSALDGGKDASWWGRAAAGCHFLRFDFFFLKELDVELWSSFGAFLFLCGGIEGVR